jgi:hypothetical protein
MNQSDANNVRVAIKRVRDIKFLINEQLYVAGSDKIVKLELGERIGFSPEGNLVNFILRIFYHYADQPEILVDFQVENIFEVTDLNQFRNKDGVFVFPPLLISTIVGLSLSHGRALLAKNTAGTRWADIILPIANPEDVARYFYPYMFDQEAIVEITDKAGKSKREPVAVNKGKKAVRH